MKILPVFRKLIAAILTAIAVSFLSFTVLYLSPGNPAEMLLMEKTGGSLNWDVVQQYADKLGMNQGFLTMYKNWFIDMLHGDLGTSYKTGVAVWEEFISRIGCSVTLAVFAMAIALTIGILLGILAARFHGSIFDGCIRFYSSASVSIPSFWLAIAFLWIFGMKLKWFPVATYSYPYSLILPASVMGLGSAGSIARLTRTYVLENTSALYVITARAKGISEMRVFLGHILKNVLLPIITMAASSTISLISGSVIIENIFSLPGIGNYLLKAIKMKDFPVILGFVFLLAFLVVIINLITEILYMILDPRVRLGAYETK